MINKHAISATFLALVLSWTNSSQAQTVEGVIQGAGCHINAQTCVTSKLDPHLILESDFVLVTDDNYFFLPNLPRHEKIQLLDTKVRIVGDVGQHQIDVSTVSKYQGHQFYTVWDWEQIQFDLYEG